MDMKLPNPVRSIFEASALDGRVIVNIGPSHPATHGTVQIIAELDGERVLRTDVHCGYLHRGFEKECEDHTWHNLIPYVCLLYTSPSPRDRTRSRMPSSA